MSKQSLKSALAKLVFGSIIAGFACNAQAQEDLLKRVKALQEQRDKAKTPMTQAEAKKILTDKRAREAGQTGKPTKAKSRGASQLRNLQVDRKAGGELIGEAKTAVAAHKKNLAKVHSELLTGSIARARKGGANANQASNAARAADAATGKDSVHIEHTPEGIFRHNQQEHSAAFIEQERARFNALPEKAQKAYSHEKSQAFLRSIGRAPQPSQVHHPAAPVTVPR